MGTMDFCMTMKGNISHHVSAKMVLTASVTGVGSLLANDHLLLHCKMTSTLWSDFFKTVDLACVFPRKTINLFCSWRDQEEAHILQQCGRRFLLAWYNVLGESDKFKDDPQRHQKSSKLYSLILSYPFFNFQIGDSCLHTKPVCTFGVVK